VPALRANIEALLLPATRDLLQAAGGERVAPPPIDRHEAILSSIGFGGADMNGALALVTVEPTVRSLVAAVFGAPADTDALLCDMVGELSNMLLGRYRSTLLRTGIEILPATPITIRASGADVHLASGKHVSWHAFSTDAGNFWLRLDVSFREGFDLAHPTHQPIDPNEQDLVLF
jgi:CheY-specific phosphatase CheX